MYEHWEAIMARNPYALALITVLGLARDVLHMCVLTSGFDLGREIPDLCTPVEPWQCLCEEAYGSATLPPD